MQKSNYALCAVAPVQCGSFCKNRKIAPCVQLPYFSVVCLKIRKLRPVCCCPTSVWVLLQNRKLCLVCCCPSWAWMPMKKNQITPCVLLPYFSVGASAKNAIYALCAIDLLQCGCFCKKPQIAPWVLLPYFSVGAFPKKSDLARATDFLEWPSNQLHTHWLTLRTPRFTVLKTVELSP